MNTLSLCWHCSALHRTFYGLLVFAMKWWSSNVCNSWTDVVYVTGNMCGVIFVCAMEAQNWLMMILLCKTLASNRMRRYTPLTWSTMHCSLNVSTPLSRSNLINNHINVSSQSEKAHNAIRALEGLYTQFGFESKSQLGVLWQLRFEHYVASREMGRHSHAKKRRFFHGLRNTWSTTVHLLCYMCCHHNSKHFIICSDIYPVCLKWRIFAVLYSYETKALCQVVRIETQWDDSCLMHKSQNKIHVANDIFRLQFCWV